ncbi:MAG: hypothetical protein ACI865_002131 [Flavobacteriaceae bacterium]|jgi:hypothetical protein
MKLIFTLVLSAISFASISSEEYDRKPEVMLQSETVDTTLSQDESIFIFQFNGLDMKNADIVYSIDGLRVTNTASINPY